MSDDVVTRPVLEIFYPSRPSDVLTPPDLVMFKGTHHENNTFPGFWGVISGLWCSHTYTNFEKGLYMIF